MTQHTGGSSDGSERNDRAELARLIAAGDWPAAQAALDSLRARYPHRPWHHASAASIAQGQGDLATALHHVDTLLAAEPGHGPMRLRRAQLLFLLDRADEALEIVAGLHRDGAAPAPLLIRAGAHLVAANRDLDKANAYLTAALDLAPDAPAAYLALADLARLNASPDTALDWVERGLQVNASHPGLLNRRVALLLEAGRTDEARDPLAALREERPDDRTLDLREAQILLRQGDAAGADACYARILAAEPDNLAAHLARIDMWMAEGGLLRATDLLEAAEKALPDHPDLFLRRIRLLRRTASPDQVVAALDDAGTAPTPALGLERALALRQAGRFDEALATLAAIPDIGARPHAAIQLNRAATLLLAGRPDEALRTAEDACATWPDHTAAWRERARALAALGRPDEALSVLSEAQDRTGPDMHLLTDRANLLLQLERHAEARGVLAEALSYFPRNDRAVVMMAEAALKSGKTDEAATILADALADWFERNGADNPDISAALALRFVEVSGPGATGDSVRSIIARLVDAAPRLSEPELTRLLNAVTSREDGDAEARVIRALLDRQGLTGLTVTRLMRHLASRTGTAQAASVTASLLARVQDNDRVMAWLNVHALLDSPALALEAARRGPGRHAARPADACLIGQMLRHSGRPRVAVRYLSRAVRCWPDDADLVVELAEALLQYNRGADALDRIAGLEARNPAFAARRGKVQRARFLMYLGRLDESLAVLSSIPDLRASELRLRLQLQVWMGDLPGAERAAQACRTDAFASIRHRAHFSTSLEGSLLSELRLFRMMEQAGQPFDRFQFFAHTRDVVAQWRESASGAGAPTAAAQSAIPPRVGQFWDTKHVPDQIAHLIETWQSADGVTHHRFDRTTARAYLAEEYDPDWVRAFRNARHAAEEADFFRLAWLARSGGLYVDADDRRVGGLNDILTQGAGALLYVEPSGCVGNNFMAARPGHPLIRSAAEAARDALLSRDNDNVWSKTGPGLMTRITARYIADTTAAGDVPDLHIVDARDLAGIVQFHVRLAYKGTPSYWNAGNAGRNFQSILDTLSDSAA